MKLEEKYGIIKEGIIFGNVLGNTSLRILKIQLSIYDLIFDSDYLYLNRNSGRLFRQE